MTLEERMLALLATKAEPPVQEPQPKTGRAKLEKRETVRGRQGETVTLRCRSHCHNNNNIGVIFQSDGHNN